MTYLDPALFVSLSNTHSVVILIRLDCYWASSTLNLPPPPPPAPDTCAHIGTSLSPYLAPRFQCKRCPLFSPIRRPPPGKDTSTSEIEELRNRDIVVICCEFLRLSKIRTKRRPTLHIPPHQVMGGAANRRRGDFRPMSDDELS